MEHPHKKSSAEEQLLTWYGSQFFKDPEIKEDNHLDGVTLERFYTGQPYFLEDITFCARSLEAFIALNQLKAYLQSRREDASTGIIFDAGVSHWVLMYITKDKKQYQVFYKDPAGRGVPQGLKETIEAGLKHEGEQFLITYHEHDANDLSGNKDHGKNVSDYTGAITIRNVAKMDTSSAQAFKKIKFTTIADLAVQKMQLVTFLAHKLVEGDDSFLQELRSIKTKLPMDLVNNVSTFREEVAGKDKKKLKRMSPKDYENKRSKYLNTTRLDEVAEQFANKSDVGTDKKDSDDQVKGIYKFQSKIEDFKRLMYIMSLCSKETNPDAEKRDCFGIVKKLLQDLFDVNYDELASVLNIIKKGDKKPPATEQLAPEPKPLKLPEECKDLETFFKDLKDMNYARLKLIDKNMDENSPSAKMLLEKADQIKELYASVMQEYRKVTYTTPRELQEWAIRRKKEQILLNEDNLVETLAILITGLKLVKGYEIRIPHLFTLLYALKNEQQGKIFQVQTGEGKTNIVALLAILKVMQGKKVDVITSNIILAKDGVQDTRDLFATFNISVDHNDPNDVAGEIRDCYTKDVVYGSITTFQFDYLKDRAEGFQHRDGRLFQELILDEVDNMLIDNGGYIAKLAEPFPGMESLRYMYIHIWMALSKADKDYGNKIQEKVDEKFGSIDKDGEVDEEKAKKYQEDYEDFLKVLSNEQVDQLKDMIKEAIPMHDVYRMIPSWVQDFVRENLDRWIENAIYAKYECRENVHYKIDKVAQTQGQDGKAGEAKDHEDSDDEELKIDEIDLELSGNSLEKTVERGKKWRVIPLDYESTGIAMTNTIWSNGLHQFVQLKHNLHLTFENLTSSYISNIGYIKLFKKPTGNITGLTGTIGSKAEQQLLDEIYKVDFVEIPTFQKKLFDPQTGVIEEDRFWHQTVLQQTVKELLKQRAVLIICETVKDAKSLEEYFYRLIAFGFNLTLKKYYTEGHAKQKTAENYELDSGYVVLATNLAGRGTDFKTGKDLNKAGGLHVIVGFLPCNKRVQEQAFGRTARTGKKGTATIVMRESQAKILVQEGFKDINKVTLARDVAEEQRLNKIRERTLPEIEFKDQLFQEYADYHLALKQRQFRKGDVGFFLMKDFKEQWAFWLKKQDLSCEKIKDKKVSEEFKSFTDKYDDQKINNPYYRIVLADQFINDDDLDKAKDILTSVLVAHAKDKHLLAAAHFKLFDAAVQSGKALEGEAFNALAKVLFGIEPDKNKSYKLESRGHLDNAIKSIKEEISFLNDQFLGEQGDLDSNPDKEAEVELPKGMKIIVAATKTKANPFFTHLYARRNYLNNLYMASKAAMKDIDEKYLNHSVDFFMENRGGFNTFLEDKKYGIFFEELAEFSTVGLNSLYTIGEVKKLKGPKLNGIRAMLGCGIALIPLAVFFPILVPLVVTLLSEAICDLIFVMMEGQQNQKEEDDGPYIRDKLITIGLSIFLIFGSASNIVASALQKGINACKSLEKFLEKIPVLKAAINRLTSLVSKCREFLQSKLKQLLDFQKGAKTGLKPMQVLREIGEGVGKNVFEHVSTLIVNKFTETATNTLKDIIEKCIKEEIGKSADFMKNLKASSIKEDDLKALIQKFDTGKDTALSSAFNTLSTFSASCCGNGVISLGIAAVRSFEGVAEVVKISAKLIDYLNVDEHLKVATHYSRDDVEQVRGLISKEAAERIVDLLSAIGKNWQHYVRKVQKPSIKEGFDVTKNKITQELKDRAPKLIDDVASAVVNNMWDSYLEGNENFTNNIKTFDKKLNPSSDTSKKMRKLLKEAEDREKKMEY